MLSKELGYLGVHLAVVVVVVVLGRFGVDEVGGGGGRRGDRGATVDLGVGEMKW